jgi:hypothetical protein
MLAYIDFAPFYRSTVGSTDCFTLDQLGGVDASVRAIRPIISSGRVNALSHLSCCCRLHDTHLNQAKENTLTIRGERQTNDEVNWRGALSRRNAGLRA